MGGKPLGPGTPKGSNSGMSGESELELETGSAERPRFVILGGGPAGGGGAREEVGAAPGSDMVAAGRSGPGRGGWKTHGGYFNTYLLCVCYKSDRTLKNMPRVSECSEFL